MKQKNMYSFFLEIIFSLILLTVAMVVALLLFANAAKIDKENRAVSQITQTMVGYSEVLRSPDNTYQAQFEKANQNEKAYFYGYDANGAAASSKVVYQLAVYIKSEASGTNTLRKSRLELRDLRDGTIIAGWQVTSFSEVQP
ncbi:MAG: hypothetical protein WBL80_09515 [Erysipelotrichaceae bacterium]